MDSIGNRIKQIRKEKKVTQKELSERVCVTQSYISRLELDKEQPTDMLLKLIALEFNVSLLWLKDGYGEMTIKNDYDYFERNNHMILQSGAVEESEQLNITLKKLNSSSINLNTVCILQNLDNLLKYHSDNLAFDTLIYEQITNIILSSCNVIEKLDKEEVNTIGELYRILRAASEDNYNALMEIGLIYEKILFKN